MFVSKIAGVNVCFTKFFGEGDVSAALEAMRVEPATRIVVIDNPATAHTVAFIKLMKEDGKVVIVRDHHDSEGETSQLKGRPLEVRQANDEIRAMLGSAAVIKTRSEHPACSTLLQAGEFADSHTFIVADADLDGLTAAMKATGVTWSEIDQDAAVLDGPRAAQTADKLSANALLLVRAMSALPAFDAARPEISEKAKAEIFAQFVSVVQGDLTAKTALAKTAEAYEQGVSEAKRLAATVTDILPGVAYVEIPKEAKFDLTTLAGAMDSRTGTKVTVQKKAIGPIAAKHNGVQYSLAVVKAEQANINLQELLLPGFVSSPEAGIISNTSFLLHVSKKVWDETVLPALFGV